MDILIEEFEENIWAIALDNGLIEGIEIDPPHENVRWGSVYWAKVKRIDASLDAAFLDLDGENTGILYNQDTRIKNKNGEYSKGGAKPIGKFLHPGDMILVQAKTAYLSSSDGYEDLENKNAQMSMDITISGRYLIYCATGCTNSSKNTISSRVRGKSEREKMQKMIDSIEDINGFILRCSAANLQTEILKREASILKDMWLQISEFLKGNNPSLIMLGPDSIQRTLSDKAINPIGRIEVVTMDHFAQVEDWCSIFAPDLMTKITPLKLDDAARDLALLEHRDLLGQIEALFHEYAFLPSGGNIIIQETAALCAIDINKGGDKRSYLAINIEAAHEIMRQIRLRNIGGIIIIDFLKMNKKDEKLLLKELNKSINKDPCTIQIHGLTKLGLMEITRKRRTPPLNKRFDGITF